MYDSFEMHSNTLNGRDTERERRGLPLMRSRAASGFLMININKNKDSDMFVVGRTVIHWAAALREVFSQSVL